MPKRKKEEAASSSDKRPRPGGWRQKKRWVEADARNASNPGSKSVLASLLLSMWCWGALSTPTVQKIASAALADGASHRELRNLAMLGSSGKCPNHMHEQLMSTLSLPSISGALDQIWVFLKVARLKIIKVKHVIMLPHVLFSKLYHEHKHIFMNSILGGDANNITRFWKTMEESEHPGYDDHPIKKRANHKTHGIPLILHSDGVPVSGIQRSWAKTVGVWSWTSYLGQGGTLFTNFLIYMIYDELNVTGSRSCLTRFFQKLLWSLHWLSLGKHPDEDDTGRKFTPKDPEYKLINTDLADGYFMELWSKRADLEEMAKVYAFPRVTEKTPCACCQANTSTIPWTDHRTVEAKWLKTIWTQKQWLRAHPNAHPLFNGTVPGFGIVFWCPDTMHTKHLGTDQYLLGGALQLLVFDVLQESQEDNLERVWDEIRDFYKDAYTILTV